MSLSEPAMFYRPEEPDNPMSGRLIVDSDGRGRAELFGDLGGPELFLESGGLNKFRRLIAETQSDQYTLDGCYMNGGKSMMFGSAMDTLTLRVQTIVKGLSFEAEEEFAFQGIDVSPQYAQRWSPKDWLLEEVYFKEQDQRGHVLLQVKDVEAETVKLDGFELTLTNRFSVSGDRYTTRAVNNRRRAKLMFDKLVPLAQLVNVAQDFQDLVSIATGRIAAFDEVSVYHPDAVRQGVSGAMHLAPLPIYRRWRAQASPSEKPPESHDLYFNYDDLGGIEGVGRWLTMAQRYRDILGRLMTTHYNTRLYLEDVALNRFVALEGFHRAWSQKKKGEYRQRLTELVTMAGDPFATLFEKTNVDTWIRMVVKERNMLAHHFGRSADYDMTPVLYLSRVAYWLNVLCLLREAGASDAVFDRWVQHNSISRLRQEMETILGSS